MTTYEMKIYEDLKIENTILLTRIRRLSSALEVADFNAVRHLRSSDAVFQYHNGFHAGLNRAYGIMTGVEKFVKKHKGFGLEPL